ncbi:MAG: cache domain-containing protein, partial [Anaerovoracaceae bacterium]
MEKRNKGKFIVILLIFAVITAFSVVYYQQGAAADAKQRTDKELSDIANEQAKTLQVRLQGQYILLETFATVLTGEGEMDPVRVQNGMDAIVENSLFLHIAVLDGTGNGRLNTGEEIFVGDRSYFQEAMAGKNIIERIEQDKLNNKVRFIQAVPLMQGGVPVGVVFGSYEEELIKELLDSEAFSDQAATYLCDSQGEIVVGSDSDVYLYREGMPLAGETNVLRGYGRERSKEEVEGFAKNLREGDAGIFTVSVEDYDRNVVYAPTGINDWFIINGVPSE